MKDRARLLRHNSTDCERLLWWRLRRRGMEGIKFRRQHPAGPYVLDFYCEKARLAIELDGGGHAEPDEAARDAKRTRDLAERGIRMLRFWNTDVLQNIEGVLQTILEAVRRAPSPRPSPPAGGRGVEGTPPSTPLPPRERGNED